MSWILLPYDIDRIVEALPQEVVESKAFEEAIHFYARLDDIMRSALRRYESAMWQLELAKHQEQDAINDVLSGVLDRAGRGRKVIGRS